MSTSNAPSLLLLPPPPEPSNRLALSQAYRVPLTKVLTKLKAEPTPAKLVVAIACSILRGSNGRERFIAWEAAQSLLAGVYTIAAVTCAQENIATEIEAGPGSVDVRVMIVDYDRERVYAATASPESGENNSAVFDFVTFAKTVGPWKDIYSANIDRGYELRNTFLTYARQNQTISEEQLIAIDADMTGYITPMDTRALVYTKGYNTVSLGGTFDYLHPGHKLLLHASALLLNLPPKNLGRPCTLIIGISADELLVSKKFADQLQSWDTRARGVLSFLNTLFEADTTGFVSPSVTNASEDIAYLRNGTVKVRLIKLHDPFGPTTSEEDVDIIVVSAETRSGGRAINERREGKGWRPLEVFEIDVLDATEVGEGKKGEEREDFSAKISSSAIREQRALAKGSGQGWAEEGRTTKE